ncbi:hypothetical protein E2C01_049066 [Portunus trituberculatus]|uniref:Uncharacterized protein n=1 Tax=Portunus trituberculatus TaxID=210409 RepID=A0A5B7GF18_PORTR|nr:hypothetical protein [Portunus trituberculatus]
MDRPGRAEVMSGKKPNATAKYYPLLTRLDVITAATDDPVSPICFQCTSLPLHPLPALSRPVPSRLGDTCYKNIYFVAIVFFGAASSWKREQPSEKRLTPLCSAPPRHSRSVSSQQADNSFTPWQLWLEWCVIVVWECKVVIQWQSLHPLGFVVREKY